MTGSPATDRLLAALILVAAVVVGLVHGRRVQFFCDDAYISYRYAENLAAGHGPVFNVWEPREQGIHTRPVEGYTNFLWVVLLAAGVKLGLGVEAFSLAAGIVLLAATLALTAGAARRLLPDRLALAAVPVLLLATLGPLVLWSVAGLESILFAFLVLLAVQRYERAGSRPARLLEAGVWYALATMTRPDGVVFGAAAGAHLLLAGLRDGPRPAALLRRAAALAGGFAALLVPFVLWRYSYYQEWLPNTFYIKAGAAISVALGAEYLGEFVRQYWLFCTLAAGGLAAGLLHPRYRTRRRTLQHYGLLVAAFAAYLVWAGGDYMALFRFLVPLLPPLALLATLGVDALLELLAARRLRQPVLQTVLLVAVLAGAGLASYRPTLQSTDPQIAPPADQEIIAPLWRMRRNTEFWVAAGRALRAACPATWTIATTAAGAIPYHAGLRTLDQSGLCDRYTARVQADQWLVDRPGHMKQATREYLATRRPEVILWHPIIRPAGSGFPTLPPTPEYVQRGLLLPDLTEEGARLFLYVWLRRDLADAHAGNFLPLGELQ